jgi:MFS transporter, DHA1 family, multidrug resistance protein
MVWDLIRDSAFGHLIRLASRGKYFQYAEEKDSSLWKKYVNEKKSGYLAHHGDTSPTGDGSEDELSGAHGLRTREAGSGSSSQDQLPDDGNTYNEASGVRVDTEKGKDQHVIDWYGPDDPDVRSVETALNSPIWRLSVIQNPRNWSTLKKFFVTGEIVFLTFSVYIGSAIYSAGIMDVTQVFGVSQVAATLGLTL